MRHWTPNLDVASDGAWIWARMGPPWGVDSPIPPHSSPTVPWPGRTGWGRVLVALACFLLFVWTPSLANAQSIGARVRTNSSANVRATPAGTVLYVQVAGRDGTVTNGPVNAVLNGATVAWWYVTWDSGSPGWVAPSVLTVLTTVATPGAFSISSVTPSCSGTNPRIVVSWSASSGATSYDVYRNGSLYTSGVLRRKILDRQECA